MRDDLIYINDGVAVPSAYSLTILEFKDLSAIELSFVYFMVDHKSPFAIYDWDQRIIEVKNSIFGEKKKFKPSAKLLAACDKYEKLLIVDNEIEIDSSVSIIKLISFTKCLNFFSK